MAGPPDPYANTAEPAPDPYAASAEGSGDAPAKLGVLDYHPPGTDATPAGSFGDRYIRPIANVERSALRTVRDTPASLLAAAKDAIYGAPQQAKDFIHPLEAHRRAAEAMQQRAQEGQPFDPNTPINYDRDLTDLAGGAVASYGMAELGMRALPAVVRKATPASLRKASQGLVGVGTRKVADEAMKTAEKAAVATEDVTTANRALEEQRTRRREIEKRTGDKTAKLASKQKAIEAKATAENTARWDNLRSEMGDENTTSAEPLRIAAEAATSEADPATSPLFKRILAHRPGEQNVSGLVPEHSAPKSWEEYEQRNDGGEPPAIDGEGGVTFGRLQRWRTYLNSKLYGGGRLEGGTYHAYKTMLRGIDSAMDDIAQKTGQTKNLADARASHTHLLDTFSDSPNVSMTAASQNLQRTNPDAFREQHDREMEGRVAHYDPTYAADAADVRKDHATLKLFPSEGEMKTSVKAPPDEPVVNVKKLREDLIRKAASRWRETSQYQIRRLAASGIGGIVAQFSGRSALEGASAGYLAAEMVPKAAASLVERPRVLEWLSMPSIEDIKAIQTIPHVDRIKIVSGLTETAVEEAKAGRRVKLSPEAKRFLGDINVALITAALIAHQPKTAGEAKARVQALRSSSGTPGQAALQ